MSLNRPQTLELQNALQQAIIACSERCLYNSARWAAELLNSLPVDDQDATSLCNSVPFRGLGSRSDPAELLLERLETPRYLMAKAFFDCHEFQRCAETLLPANPPDISVTSCRMKSARPPSKKISQRGLFLACYALLIQGEKQKAEDASQILSPSDTGTVTNKQLARIRSILEQWFALEKDNASYGSSQGWLEYLYGMVLAKDQNYDLAKIWLLKSVSINPWNWGTWQELCCLVRDANDLDSIYSKLQPSIMAFVFSVCCRQELHQPLNVLLSDISQLQNLFPGSSFLQGQRALAYYRMKKLESANSAFSDMLISHWGYLEFLDHYSNVLYTLGSEVRLSFMAQVASSIEPYRPETCCVIGNYYSLSSRHQDAIIYFRRALILDRNFSSAWTLLGHEYLKLENSHAAMSSYIRAIGLNNHDYRAYFGLAQGYESLEQPKMALSFYQRAVLLRSGELDLWQAMARCLVTLTKLPQAVKSLKRALSCTNSALRSSEDCIDDVSHLRRARLDIFFEIARLYDELHDRQEATSFLERCLDEALEYSTTDTEEEERNQYILKAQLLLARWAVDDGDYTRAQYFANQARQSSGRREEAQRLLEECTREESV
ncbi:cell division cycle protein-like protein 23 [Xylaria sp. FL0933]|nr:cell division cycle protein-like protein 23 [Xylaria sp. FL0933]